MSPLYEHVEVGKSQSLKVREYAFPFMEVPWHTHPQSEVLLFTQGAGEAFIAHRHYRFRAGDIFVIAPDTPHYFISERAAGMAGVVVLQFDPVLVEDTLAQIPELQAGQMLFDSVQGGEKYASDDATFSLLSALAGQSPQMRFFSFLQLMQVLAHQAPSPVEGEARQAGLREATLPAKLRNALSYIQSRCFDELTLDDAAAHVGMEKTAFCRLFKQHTRRTFSQYLNDMRVDHASHLLLTTGHAVTYVALDSGYRQTPYFIRQFKQRTGLTPSQFREQYRALDPKRAG